MTKKTTLAEIVVYMQENFARAVRGNTLRKQFPDYDLDHLVNLGILGRTRQNAFGDELFWVRPVPARRRAA